MNNPNKIVYSLNVEDVQNVAQETFGRKLTEKEISLVQETVGDYIDWFGAIEYAIHKQINRNKKSN